MKGSLEKRRQVAVFAVPDGRQVFAHAASGLYNNVDFSPDGRFLAFVTANNFIIVRDLNERRTLAPIRCARQVRHLVFDPNGRYIAVEQYCGSGHPGSVLIMEWRKGKAVHELKHADYNVRVAESN